MRLLLRRLALPGLLLLPGTYSIYVSGWGQRAGAYRLSVSSGE